MLRQMGQQFIVEEAVAVMSDEAINVGRIGGSDAKRRLKMLTREREAMHAVVRSGDDDEQPGRRAFKYFFVGPGISQTAAAVVDVRNKGGAKMRIGPTRTRLAGTAGRSEEAVEQAAQAHGIIAVTGGAGGRTDGIAGIFAQASAETRSFEKQSIVELP